MAKTDCEIFCDTSRVLHVLEGFNKCCRTGPRGNERPRLEMPK